MLGEIVSGPRKLVDQYGQRDSSVLSIIRWRAGHGQSNAIHLGRARGPTKTAPLRGSRSGTLSPESTTATTRQRKIGSHCHQRIFVMSAMPALKTVVSCRLPAYSWPGDNSDLLLGARRWLKSRARGNATKLRSDVTRVRSRSVVPIVR